MMSVYFPGPWKVFNDDLERWQTESLECTILGF